MKNKFKILSISVFVLLLSFLMTTKVFAIDYKYNRTHMHNLKTCKISKFTTRRDKVREYTINGKNQNGFCNITLKEYDNFKDENIYNLYKSLNSRLSEYKTPEQLDKEASQDAIISNCLLSQKQLDDLYNASFKNDGNDHHYKISEDKIIIAYNPNNASSYEKLIANYHANNYCTVRATRVHSNKY